MLLIHICSIRNIYCIAVISIALAIIALGLLVTVATFVRAIFAFNISSIRNIYCIAVISIALAIFAVIVL